MYLISLLLLLLHVAHAQAPDDRPVQVQLWHAYRGEERNALDRLITQYNATHDDVQVNALAIPFDAFVSKFEAATPQGNGPDLFIFAHERVGGWSQYGSGDRKLIAPIDLPTDGLHPSTVDAFRYDDVQYGLPLAYKCLALFYNKALVSDVPQTTDALETWARDFQAAAPPGQTRFGLAYQATEPFFHTGWMHGFGGGFYSADGATVMLDRPGNAASMAYARRLLDEGLIPDESTGTLVTNLFNQGLAAMVINGPWFLGEIDPSVDFGVAQLPIVSATGRRAAPFLTAEGVMISGYAAHPQQARELAAWLVAPDQAIVRAIEGRQAVATLAAYDDPQVANDPILSAFRKQLNNTVPMPNSPQMASTWEPMARALRKVMRGALSPEDAVTGAMQEYRIVTRPAPPPANPWPYIIVVGLLATAGLGYVGVNAVRRRSELRQFAYAYAYVAPASLAMALLVIVPFVVGAAVSLFAHHNGSFTFVGLANFFNIILARDWAITSPLSFYFTLGVTVLWTASNVALHVSIGVFLALLLREPWLRLKGVYRVLLILPWAVPNYITALIWKGMFHRQFGAINGILGLFGVEPISWFSHFTTAFAANLITNTWLGFPFMMVVTLGALQSIPRDLEQAAEVDGANAWQRFRHVTLPLLKPALLPAIILGSVWTFNMFNIIYLVSAGEPDGGTEILISEAYRWAFTRDSRYGYAAAYAVLIFFVLLFYSRGMNKLAGRKVL